MGFLHPSLTLFFHPTRLDDVGSVLKKILGLESRHLVLSFKCDVSQPLEIHCILTLTQLSPL